MNRRQLFGLAAGAVAAKVLPAASAPAISAIEGDFETSAIRYKVTERMLPMRVSSDFMRLYGVDPSNDEQVKEFVRQLNGQSS